MSRLCLSLASLVLPLLAFAADAEAQTPVSPSANIPALDPSSFATELRRLDAALCAKSQSAEEIRVFLNQLPASWQVQTADRSYNISSSPLRTLLGEGVRDVSKRESRLADAKSWLDEMAAQAEASDAARPSTGSDPRSLAGQILRRPEFTPLRPPSPLDLFRQRLNEWLLRMLGRFFSSLARHPIGGEILFWLIIAAVVLWLAVSLFRYWTRSSPLEELTAPERMMTTRTWQEWVRAARRAAECGDFREAVHSVYWAGIVYLEVAGIVAPDRARTPREYLRLLENSGALEAAPQKKRRETLAALTAHLERVWYGFRLAGPEDFRECLEQLEMMGCQLQ